MFMFALHVPFFEIKGLLSAIQPFYLREGNMPITFVFLRISLLSRSRALVKLIL